MIFLKLCARINTNKYLFDKNKVKFIFIRRNILISGRRTILKNRFSQKYIRCESTVINPIILGIESSCDDTAAAVIDGSGKVLGESIYSQAEKSVMYGGVVPGLSLKFHEINISKAVNDAIEEGNIRLEDITAVAITVEPGNKGNLRTGCKYAKYLCRKYNKPLIPVHHMQAHALTVRMLEKVEFPYLVMLISGGNFIYAVARGIGDYIILMDFEECGPGCSLDQISRRLKLKNLKEYEKVCGGRAIEMAAKEGDCKKYELMRITGKDYLNGSFSGLQGHLMHLIPILEKDSGIRGGNLLPDYKDICASIQYSITKKLVRLTQKAMAYVRYADLLPRDNLQLVLSGGVACNQYIRNALERVCEMEEYSFHVPPPRLCTDNGIMIAWTGLEQWRVNKNILFNEEDIRDLRVKSHSLIGTKINPIEFRNVMRPIYLKF